MKFLSVMFYRSFVAVLLVVAIALGGCSPAQFRTEAAQVPRLVISELSDPKTFNAVLNSEVTVIFGLLYSTLLEQNGQTGELEPGLAESWEISDDQQRIVFTLREGLKWSDDQPFTVDDITFSFNEIYFNPKIPTSTGDIFRIGEAGRFPQVRKVDDRRVEFITPEPFAPILRFAGSTEIMPKHAVEKYVRTTDAEGSPQFLSLWGTDTDPSQIVCNGLYRLLRYEPNQRIIFERNPNYWKQDAQGNPQPYIERVIVQLVESTDSSLVQFRSGGLDAIGISANYFALVKREEERGDFTIYNGGPSLSSSFLAFNLNQGRRNGQPVVDPIKSRWFNTLAFRQAVAYAIDRQSMINNSFQGLGVPQNSPIYIQSPYYAPEGLRTYDFNLEKSKQLLEQAGFKYTNGQLFDADGNRVRFTLTTNAEANLRVAIGAQIKQDLSRLGMQVDFQPIAFNTLLDKIDNTMDWDAMIMGFGGAGIEPDGGRNVWSPDGRLHMFNQKPGEGQAPLEGRVVADWEAEIGRLYVRGSQELDDTKRKAIYAEAQQLVQEHIPFIYLVNPLSLSAIRNRVENVKFAALGGSLWNLNELRLRE